MYSDEEITIPVGKDMKHFVGIITSAKKKEVDYINFLYGEIPVVELDDEKEDLIKELDKLEPDIVIFIAWSWIVPKNDYDCFCIHPSPLPLYRGGSPIQAQILAGEKTSKVTLFMMENPEEGIDVGDIISQQDYSLEGTLDDIFRQISFKSTVLIEDFIRDYKNNVVRFYPQDHSKATICKRRKPEESEITLEELQTKDAEYLYNKIRCLYSEKSKYPTAFVRTKDGKKLFLTTAKLEDKNG
jgi:methionyl-tRNA formyltransferase